MSYTTSSLRLQASPGGINFNTFQQRQRVRRLEGTDKKVF